MLVVSHVVNHYQKAIHDRQLEYILEKEKELGQEFEKLERDRLRLLQELEEMRVNQSFEDFYKQHKSKNGSSTNLNSLSEAELFRKQMQDEWLNKVAEREERRMQKIIKITKATEECNVPKTTVKGISDEFLDRVKERRTKLQIPSDSDWESGAESQPTPCSEKSPNIDPSVKILDGECEADLKKLPKHLKEFAEFTTKNQSTEITTETTETETKTSNSKEIIHQIERHDDGESPAFTYTVFGLCFAIAALYWTFYRSITY